MAITFGWLAIAIFDTHKINQWDIIRTNQQALIFYVSSSVSMHDQNERTSNDMTERCGIDRQTANANALSLTTINNSPLFFVFQRNKTTKNKMVFVLLVFTVSINNRFIKFAFWILKWKKQKFVQMDTSMPKTPGFSYAVCCADSSVGVDCFVGRCICAFAARLR